VGGLSNILATTGEEFEKGKKAKRSENPNPDYRKGLGNYSYRMPNTQGLNHEATGDDRIPNSEEIKKSG